MEEYVKKRRRIVELAKKHLDEIKIEEVEDYTGKKRRVVELATKYWDEIKVSGKSPNKNWPTRNEVQESEIMVLWQHCFIIGVRGKYENGEVISRSYVCESSGKRATEFYGFEEGKYINNRYATDAPFLYLYTIDAVLEKFDTVMENGCPCPDSEESENVRMRQVLLPLGDEREITHILGVITFKLL